MGLKLDEVYAPSTHTHTHLEVATLVRCFRWSKYGYLPGVKVTFIGNGYSKTLHWLSLKGLEFHGKSPHRGGAGRRHPANIGYVKVLLTSSTAQQPVNELLQVPRVLIFFFTHSLYLGVNSPSQCLTDSDTRTDTAHSAHRTRYSFNFFRVNSILQSTRKKLSATCIDNLIVHIHKQNSLARSREW